MKYLVRTLLASAMLGIAAPVMALTASQTVQREVRTQMPDGTEQVTLADADKVIPGERIIYTLNYANDKSEPASNLVLTMPVPEVVDYVEGSASGMGTTVVYSADGGKNFTARENLRVADVDGTMRSARAEEVTHIRWTIAGPVNPGETGALAFKGRLK